MIVRRRKHGDDNRCVLVPLRIARVLVGLGRSLFDLRLHDVHSKLVRIRDSFGIRLDREIDLGHGFDGGMSTFIALSLFSNSMR